MEKINVGYRGLGVGVLVGRCSEAKNEVHLFKNHSWPFKGTVAIECA